MARPRLMTDQTSIPNVIRRRPTDVGTIIGHSTEVHPLTPAILDRPGWQGAFEGASINQQPSVNDGLIVKSRGILYRDPQYIPPATGPGNISWTAAGPVRQMFTTRFNRNIRPIVGGSYQSRWGLHTTIPTGQQIGNQLKGKKRMGRGRQNRLSVQRYRGQSFSATTQITGSGR